MRSFLYLFIALQLFSNEAQFDMVIKGSFNAALFDVVEDYNGHISAVGYATYFEHPTFNSEAHSAFEYLDAMKQNRGEQFKLITVARDGTLQNNVDGNLPTFNQAINAVKSRQDGYFIGGFKENGNAMLIKLRANGTTLFERYFGTANYDKLYRLIALKDEGVLALGTSMTSREMHDDMFVSGLGGNDLLLTRFTAYGVKRWSHKYGTSFDDRAVGIIEMDDGTLVMLSVASLQTKRKIHLMRLSENGDTIWSETYDFDNFSTATDLLKLPNDNFLITFCTQQNMVQAPVFAIFDLEHNLRQYKKITLPFSTSIKRIKQLNNGQYVAVGNAHISGKEHAIVLFLDHDLNLLHYRKFDANAFSSFYNLTILRDSTIAIVGSKSLNDEQVQHLWLTLLNPDGTTALKQGIATSLYQALIRTFDKEIKNGDIAINTALQIELLSPRLQFKVGEYLLTSEQKAFLALFFKKLLPLLTIYHEAIDSFQINGHTSSEWKNAPFNKRYINNATLSSNRALSVTRFLFEQSPFTPYQQWLSHTIESDAHAFAKVRLSNKHENRAASRRVNFGIILKAR